jgi:hypothetical protein
MRTTPVVLQLRLRTPPGGRAALIAFLSEAIPYYESIGNTTVRLLESRDVPDAFIEQITYTDHATYERDQRRTEEDPVMKALLARWRSLLAGPPTVEWWDDATIDVSPPEAR